ncbi:uncharacterized protein CIMG_10698 [Coccidioides immitis RS]|uniref:Uncharacterized protein n=3 Tax=Coccidioides immitis TaxID=5501 RepID=A0A0D8JVA8_COCIM|nr:uncharacterized protein CIMG_10698 [Coccidioides immitis RS]KJF60198.1 hypothetical protein CIMG_10698 [Coccidioides immitis RS]KMP01161.1 hypothetical protein CIRG_01301 [Coccidioides immitis RMSCC 2394]KMU74255.1 hypothetical protein CISG_04604 [Coccidioides immitis RMSCC 3703]
MTRALHQQEEANLQALNNPKKGRRTAQPGLQAKGIMFQSALVASVNKDESRHVAGC